MIIGIYKPGKPIYFRDEEGRDRAGYNREIVNFIRFIEKFSDHQIVLRSPTDRREYINMTIKVDLLVVFNGRFSKHDEDYIANHYCKKILCVSDLRLLPKELEEYSLVLCQSKRQIVSHDNLQYFPFQELVIMDYVAHTTRKTQLITWAGGERNRLSYILEYVIRPNTYFIGKAESLKFDQRSSYHVVQRMLSKAKYSIVFADPHYHREGFVTQRYWECITNHVIPFVVEEYDEDEIIIDKDDYRRVRNYKEMYLKLLELESNLSLKNQILINQSKALHDEDKRSGKEYFKRFKKAVESIGVNICLKDKN